MDGSTISTAFTSSQNTHFTPSIPRRPVPFRKATSAATGMICNEFKGGIGTSSRKLAEKAGGYTVGVLVQCNYGVRPNLRIAGVPVGKEIPEDPAYATASFSESDRGSIIVVVATDAPLVSHQLKRLARRVSLGLG